MRPLLPLFGALTLIPLLVACEARTPEGGSAPEGASSSHLLEADIPDALPVVEAQKQPVGAKIAVYGRVRRIAHGGFWIVDDDVVHYCGKGGEYMDTCPTPWDFCCDDKNLVTKVTLVVDAKDAEGRDIPRSRMGIREVDLVALRGTLVEEGGKLVLQAEPAWHRRERPKVHANVKFP